jgi:hypothetical protein
MGVFLCGNHSSYQILFFDGFCGSSVVCDGIIFN